jgi:hypothetical protein
MIETTIISSIIVKPLRVWVSRRIFDLRFVAEEANG